MTTNSQSPSQELHLPPSPPNNPMANAQPSIFPPNMPRPTQQIPPKSSVIKTDKPRPHVCLTCTRSFARLEHLKRHERSHTKEKPFQCPVCERCFARRDLLLRHRQKLHASFPETPRVRATAKRKSVSVAKAAAKTAKSTSSSSPGSSEVQQSPLPPSTGMSPPSIPGNNHELVSKFLNFFRAYLSLTR